MPHKCTNCQNVIPDESEDLLEGCSECGNDSWEYLRQVQTKESSNSGVSIEEDDSQRDARTDFVDQDELPPENSIDVLQNPSSVDTETDTHHEKVDEVDKIREQLNRQYEGINIHRKGHYEINLTELYRGNDYIIEIGDDGAYQVKKARDIKE